MIGWTLDYFCIILDDSGRRFATDAVTLRLEKNQQQ